MKKRFLQAITMAVVAVMLSACGFQLRGSHTFPFKHLFIAGGTPAVTVRFKRAIEGGSDTVVVDTPKDADAILVLSFGSGQSALSFNANGVVQEYVLTTSVSYSLTTTTGVVLIPSSALSVNRAMSYSNQYALAKQTESQVLNDDMNNDLVDQIVRRLDAVRTVDPDSPPVPGVRSRAPLPTPPL